jgi:hypothetical protein
MDLKVRLVVRVAWWARVYLIVLEGLCNLLGREPDASRVAVTIKRGIRVRAEEVR